MSRVHEQTEDEQSKPGVLLAVRLTLFAALLSAVFVSGCAVVGMVAGEPKQLSYEIVAVYPHDPTWFTQGLEYFEGIVYESTGLVGESSLRALDLAELERLANVGVSGAETSSPTASAIKAEISFANEFGEGLTRVGDLLYWLTWRAGEVATFRITDQGNDLTPGARFSYEGEGWGLCYNDYGNDYTAGKLVRSNGTNKLMLHKTEGFAADSEIVVADPVGRLNELECVDGLIWANVWQTDRIVVINPNGGDSKHGVVVAEANVRDLISAHPADADPEAVLNGIAYRSDTDTFLLTGKRWPQMFEVRFNAGDILQNSD